MKRKAVLEAFSDSEDEDEKKLKGPQLITGFSAEEGVHYQNETIQRIHEKKRAPKIIHIASDENWMEKRKARFKKKETEVHEKPSQLPDSGLNYGLNIRVASSSAADNEIVDWKANNSNEKAQNKIATNKESTDILPEEVQLVLNDLNDDVKSANSANLQPITTNVVNEKDAYRKDIDELPEPSNMKDYSEIPVEEFGAAMLRGMGWNGQLSSKDAFDVNQRPTFLGMGAKPVDSELTELDIWKNPKKTMFLPVKPLESNSALNSQNEHTEVQKKSNSIDNLTPSSELFRKRSRDNNLSRESSVSSKHLDYNSRNYNKRDRDPDRTKYREYHSERRKQHRTDRYSDDYYQGRSYSYKKRSHRSDRYTERENPDRSYRSTRTL
ncbi:splicing factor Cwf28 [Schizosaccharomyces pombe]|uniref:Pre-mRNA-splicing factor cwf28 n=1 Tax=Schizosaccharomyces pombe (strain 972 / ATCC 24843) TaxID=284812 RepID=SPP2_SCHPO|nr:splicing factor Cwf28 [Schizosaccharomyces pombe]O43031.3 RecName: Full=Pre-mRNA-splicing factor cwf28; AltName: Full=Complexed with cdc5 protein 28 [Schizosaccharomyces pombe 972h-]CAA17782.1 splicing factor Cwf28 [Schizosaccharomyces pombe]|eukprot:NP_596659.1 splicing factor Cwf28 [Schizosaccharomyces pombe]